jgi:hypothetical protein
MDAICYLTCNKNTIEMERRFSLLPNNTDYSSFILSEEKNNLSFNTSKFLTFNPKNLINIDNILRHTYLAIVDFYNKFPEFKNYWLLEDDVVFNGDFLDFFDFYKVNNADLIVPYCNINTDPSDAKNAWFSTWFNSIHGNYKTKIPLAGGLAVIARFSNRLLEKISYLTKEGVYGHLETFPQTVCLDNGFKFHYLKNDLFYEEKYCNWCTGFQEKDLKDIPKNKLVHAIKF